MKFVVIVKQSELQQTVYGPYSTFKAAEGDAKAWGGSVEPLRNPSEHTDALTKTETSSRSGES